MQSLSYNILVRDDKGFFVTLRIEAMAKVHEIDDAQSEDRSLPPPGRACGLECRSKMYEEG
jgi:hypothetical protein